MRFAKFLGVFVALSMLVLPGFGSQVHSQTILTVNSITDEPDLNKNDGLCLTSLSTCTFRAAIEQANQIAGTDEIRFNIPQNLKNPNSSTVGFDYWSIYPLKFLPAITSPVIINGATQPGYGAGTHNPGLQPVIEINFKNRAPFSGPTSERDARANGSESEIIFYNGSAGSSLQGLSIANSKSYSGSNLGIIDGAVKLISNANTIKNSYIGVDITGKKLPDDTPLVQQSTGKKVAGNYNGIVVSGSNNIIGGNNAQSRNVISGNYYNGVVFNNFIDWVDSNMVVVSPNNNFIQGNYIGADVTGQSLIVSELPSRPPENGILLEIFGSASNNQIGGSPSEGNVIVGTKTGIFIKDLNDYVNVCTRGSCPPDSSSGQPGTELPSITNTLITGNSIGTNKTGQKALPNQYGIKLGGKNGIIGTEFAPNTIAFNTFDGIKGLDEADTYQNKIRFNSMFENGEKGIDLEEYQYEQLSPVVSKAQLRSGKLEVTYQVPKTSGFVEYPFTLDWYKADAQNQEGKTYVGSSTYTQAQAGQAFTTSFTPTMTIAAGQYLVATATDSLGNTSEFSQSIQVVDAPQSCFLDVAGHVFETPICKLKTDGIVGGFGDGKFYPENGVTRGQMAKFVKNALFGNELVDTSCSSFPDIASNHTFYKEITTLKCKGVVSGFADGSFKADNSVTRGQSMKFVINGARIAKNNPYLFPIDVSTQNFGDVPNNHPFYEFIMAGYSNEIVSGRNGNFYPDEVTSRGGMSKIVDSARSKS